MKKQLFGVCVILSILFINSQLVEAAPEYRGQNAQEYFDELVREATTPNSENPNDKYEVLSSGEQTSMPISKLKRELIIENKEEQNKPQFYLNFTDKYSTEFQSYIRPKESFKFDTTTVSGKLRYVNEIVKKNTYSGYSQQSQLLFPYIYTRYRESYGKSALRQNIPSDDLYKSHHAFPQGFMYAESDENGENTKINQFDYVKNGTGFKLLWNKETESMKIIAKEKDNTTKQLGDKVFVMTTSIDEVYRYVKVSGELHYLGKTPKKITLLNQMSYDPMLFDSMQEYVKAPFYVYGNGRGITMKNFPDASNLTIRFDTGDDRPRAWMLSDKEYMNLKDIGNPALDIADPNKFFEGFNPPNIKGTGYESTVEGNTPGTLLTKEYKYGSPWGKYYGSTSVNSFKLMSDTKELQSGNSISLSYGFQPTTSYQIPSILELKNINKTDDQAVETAVNWVDQHVKTSGGTIKVFINGKDINEDLVYQKNGDVEGSVDLHISPDKFKSGIENTVTLEIRDDLYGTGVPDSEHSFTRSFKVTNRRVIPISYQTTKGTELEVGELYKKTVALMDNESVTIQLPATLGEKKYPLENAITRSTSKIVLNKSKNELTITGQASADDLDKGVSIIYKILEVDATVKFINSNGKPILKDIKSSIPLENYTIPDLEVGKNLKEALDKAKTKLEKPLKLDYTGYKQLPNYKVLVDGKEVADPTVIPDSDFEIVFTYEGETNLVNVPNILFGKENIINDSDTKQVIQGDEKEATVEMYDTSNQTDSKVTVSLEGDILNKAKQLYGGEIRFKTGRNNEEVALKKGLPVLILKSTKDKSFNSLSLKNTDTTKPSLYMVQYPGNYEGDYQASLVWKLEPDTVKKAAQ